MSDVSTTRMSSKGQVVIPEEIRKRLGLKAGARFVVVGEKDVVILKSVTAPSLAEFDKLIVKVREKARQTGLKQADINKAIAKARKR